jgi:RHS repeat-associated protein
VQFLARGSGYTAFLKTTGVVFSESAKQGPNSIVQLQLIGANAGARASGLDLQLNRTNYLLGNDPMQWHTNVPNYGRVVYSGVYPGIDLTYYGNQDRQLEYDFVVHPGADPSRIAVNVQGASGMSVDAGGDLVIATPAGNLVEHAPVIYQQTAQGKQVVTGGYAVSAANQVAFNLGNYNPTQPLVIDPSLTFSSYIGGTGDDIAYAVASDKSGYTYLTGSTNSASLATMGSFQTTGGGGLDAFVSKINPGNGSVIYTTYLGGSLDDIGRAIAVDGSGNVFVAGSTSSTTFPTLDPYQASNNKKPSSTFTNAFVTELNLAGSALVFSTYLGGSGGSDTTTVGDTNDTGDVAYGIAIDSSDNVFVTGSTVTTSTVSSPISFPTAHYLTIVSPPYTGNTNQSGKDRSDAFVSELSFSSSTLTLDYSTYLGGSGTDVGRGIAVDSSDNVYVTGYTSSANYLTKNAYQSTSNGGDTSDGNGLDAFMTELSFNTMTSTLSLAYSTYLGGAQSFVADGDDLGLAIALDASGNVYMTGRTGSVDKALSPTPFPVTSGAYQVTYGGGKSDAFVAKFNPNVSGTASLVYSTYLGGNGDEDKANLNGDTFDFAGIAVDPFGRAYVTGSTLANIINNFPVINATQSSPGDTAQAGDGYISVLSADGSNVGFSTFLGGSNTDIATAIALDPRNNPTVAGYTQSTNFPTANAIHSTEQGGVDVFVTRVDAGLSQGVPTFDAAASGELITTVDGATGGDPASGDFSGVGVRYGDGTVKLSATDLSSQGMGIPWGQGRIWTNGNWVGDNSINGNGMVDTQMPYLIDSTSDDTIIAVTGGTNARYFDLLNGNYQERLFLTEQLVHNTTTHQFTLTDDTGNQLLFNDFTSNWNTSLQGKLVSMTGHDNNVTSVAYDSNHRIQDVTRSYGTAQDDYHYDFSAGLLADVQLKRTVNSTQSIVRQVVYTYYATGANFGNPGDLKTAVVEDGSGTVLATSYYRYYTHGDANPNGYTHGLKYFFSTRSYQRLVTALGTSVDTLSDASVAPYADNYFEYDPAQRVTRVDVQGSDTSSGFGLSTYRYSYVSSSFGAGADSWQTQTTESLPNQTTNIVFSNAYGEPMVAAHNVSGSIWETFNKYDSSGRIVLTASPTAIQSVNGQTYDTTRADLMNGQTGSYVYLNNNSGLLTQTDYYMTTTATSTTEGGVTGYKQDVMLLNGQSATGILQNTRTYFVQTAGNITIYPLAGDKVYSNTDGTGLESTNYTYTFFTNSTQPSEVDVTSPNIPTAQNGPGVRDVNSSFFDTLGRVTGTTDADGFKTSTTYDDGTSAVTQSIKDSASGGLNLTTTMTVDSLGRTTKLIDPNGNITYTVYDDPDHEVRTYVGWISSSNTPTLPTQVTRQDWANNYDETLTMSAAPHITNGAPDGTESISSLQSLSRNLLDYGSRVIETDSYFNLPSYSTTVQIGTLNTNYYAGYTGYDVMSNTNHTQDDTGTIDDTQFDGLDRAIQMSEGTNDTNNNNMVVTDALQYDNGGVGDGDLTNGTEDTGGSAPNRVDQKFYDWRDRVVAEKQGVQASESTTVHRPIIYTTFDNLNEATQVQSYDGDGVTITTSNGVPQPPAASLLRKQTVNNFDEQRRIYQSLVYDVNQTSGAVGNALTTNFYFNHRGLLIEQVDPGGLVTKTTYDGAGRTSIVYKTDGGSGTGWFQASNVSNDNVLLQTVTSYDSDGQVTLVQTKQRFDSETTKGVLGNATTAPLARVSYVANYYDNAERQVAAVDFGTNGAMTFTRPSTVPARSDTVLVTGNVYNAAGEVQDVYDPRNLDTRTFYDGLGRKTSVVQDYTNGTPTNGSNRTTNYTYFRSNLVQTVTAALPSSAVETTQYSYGVSPANGSSVTSNDLLNTTAYPDPTLGTPSASLIETYKYNELNQATQMTDRNGNVHAYTFDVLGRQTADAVSTLGSGVDSHVQEIDTAYNDLNLPFQSTSLATPGGSVVNQVQLTYNGFGQLTSDQQAHGGAVGSGTPKVQYSYVDGSGANNSRQVTMTDPGGRVITDGYGTTGGLNDTISRLNAVLDGSTTLESYKYLGLGTVVERDHPTPLVNLTYISQSGGTGDAGDKYTGLDRFGRVVEQNWYSTFSHASRDDFLYLYDRDSNALYKQNTLDLALSELYHANGSANGYDQFNQISAFAVGTLSASGGTGTPLDTIATPSTSESWSLDALGNWSSQTINGTRTSRTTNLQNEQTAVGSASLTYDKNGNTTVDNLGHTLVYDAWNRLVAVKNGGTTLAAYAFDGMGRRIQETAGSTTLDLYFSQDRNIIEQDVSGAVQATYVWNPLATNSLVERDRGAERLYVEQDANGNVTSLVNTSGTVVERYRYDAYGNVTYMNASWSTISASAYAAVYLFQGGRLDPNTGNYIFQARDYSPSLGHWLEQDPAGYGAGSLDLYGAEGDNPVNRSDPTGRDDLNSPPLYFPGTARPSNAQIQSQQVMIQMLGGKEHIQETIAHQRAIVFRVGAGASLVGHFVETVGGLATAETGAGGYFAVHGTAGMAADYEALVSGQPQQTVIEKGYSRIYQSVGANPQGADRLAAWTDFGATAGAGLLQLRSFPGAPEISPELSTLQALDNEAHNAAIFAQYKQYLAAQQFQDIVTAENVRLGNNPSLAAVYLSAREYAAGQSSPGLANLQYGNALERMVADTIANDRLYSSYYLPLGGPRKPDFAGLGPVAGVNYDITTDTLQSLYGHLSRPYGEGLIFGTYSRPPDFSQLP